MNTSQDRSHAAAAEREADASSGLSRSSRGQALVEFALILPVLLLILLLTVDFGRLFFSYVAVNNAAREATNYAAMHAGDPDYDAAAFDAAVGQVAAAEANVQAQGGENEISITGPVCFAPGTEVAMDCNSAAQYAGGIGNHVRVTASQPFDFMTPIIGDVVGSQLVLSASATGAVLNPINPAVLDGGDGDDGDDGGGDGDDGDDGGDGDDGETGDGDDGDDGGDTCTVPLLTGRLFNNPSALNTWHNEANFTGTLTNDVPRDNQKIKYQSLAAYSEQPCDSNMRVWR